MDPNFPDINIPKTNTVINAYNMEVLQKVLGKAMEKEKSHDSAEISESGATEKPKISPQKETKSENDWRYMPICDKDLMIISSFGDEWDPSIQAVPKQQDNATAMNGKVVAARKEMEAIIDQCKGTKTLFLQDVYPDFPGAQLCKDDLTDRIKQFLQKCEKDGAVIWYTGHGEKNTGNWCFKDGVITFQDIFGLYMDCFRGKQLTIVSDCSYSGNWIKDCVKILDDIGIPSCGHHTKEQGILIKVFSSCKSKEEATVTAFINEAVAIDEKKKSLNFYSKELSTGQNTAYGDFIQIRCSKATEPCEINSKWKDRFLEGSRLFLLRGKDRGRKAWHYLLVDEDKLDAYNALFSDGSRPNINCDKYGKVVYSGWGEDPPKETLRKIKLRFHSVVDPEQ